MAILSDTVRVSVHQMGPSVKQSWIFALKHMKQILGFKASEALFLEFSRLESQTAPNV